MLILELTVFLVYAALLQRDSAYESSQDYYDDYQDPVDKGRRNRELEQQLRSVSSVDELMAIFYPEQWKMLRCQSQGGHPQYRGAGLSTASEEPVAYAASFYNPEILKSIDYEWRKTQCMPREVSLDVGREFGSATSIIFKPSCVSVYRCGGCCNSEGISCMNTSTTYVSKTLFEISIPISQVPKPVTISVANHTGCRCMSKMDFYRQAHSIIRRSISTSPSDCLMANKTCPKNHIWNSFLCRCVLQYDLSGLLPSEGGAEAEPVLQGVCGSHKELDVDSCQCVCKGGADGTGCGPHRELDTDTCQCVCRNGQHAASCGPHRQFDADTCQCMCKRSCPRQQPLNTATCVCECTQSPNKCFLRGQRFYPHTCSCYRPPCRVRRKGCKQGLYFSEEVCNCVPTYWRRPYHGHY